MCLSFFILMHTKNASLVIKEFANVAVNDKVKTK